MIGILIGVVIFFVLLVIYSSIKVSSECSRWEERQIIEEQFKNLR